MTACLFGCDALFELGYVGVDGEGRIVVSQRAAGDPSLHARVDLLRGRRCTAATSSRGAYFAWHRANRYQG